MSRTGEVEYLDFALVQGPARWRTSCWEVRSAQSGDVLGLIKWYAPWRQYCFFARADTVFSKGCLGSIETFIAREMATRRLTAVDSGGKTA